MKGLLLILLIIPFHYGFCQKNDTTYLDNGLKYIRLEKGRGKPLQIGQKIKVQYTGYVAKTQKPFGSNCGKKPFRFTLGAGEVIEGWDLALPHLKVQEKIKLFVPAKLGYGQEGIEDPSKDGEFIIPPNADLIFEIEVVEAN